MTPLCDERGGQSDAHVRSAPPQGRLLSLLDDNTIHLWELAAREEGGVTREGVVCLQEVESYILPGRPGIEGCRYAKA